MRDTFAELMGTVKCKDVQNEPVFLPVDGLELLKGTVLGDQARLDISARSIWNASVRACFDVRVFHAPNCILLTMQGFLKWRKEASHLKFSRHLVKWVVKLKDW